MQTLATLLSNKKNMLIDLNEDTLADLITENEKVVQFSASWCGNCRIMKPKFKKIIRQKMKLSLLYC
jgi:thiol-disulfide isomerase/thioredoxin